MKGPYIALFVFSLLLLFSCGEKGEDHTEIPAGILDQKTFGKVLIDFALAESIQNLNVSGVPFQSFDTVYAFNPLVEHGVRKGQYDSTILFYAAHPKLYRQVYDTVLVKLEELKVARRLQINPPVTK